MSTDNPAAMKLCQWCGGNSSGVTDDNAVGCLCRAQDDLVEQVAATLWHNAYNPDYSLPWRDKGDNTKYKYRRMAKAVIELMNTPAAQPQVGESLIDEIEGAFYWFKTNYQPGVTIPFCTEKFIAQLRALSPYLQGGVKFCEDEGCEHYGTKHYCNLVTAEQAKAGDANE